MKERFDWIKAVVVETDIEEDPGIDGRVVAYVSVNRTAFDSVERAVAYAEESKSDMARVVDPDGNHLWPAVEGEVSS